jgi:hypothetical protein
LHYPSILLHFYNLKNVSPSLPSTSSLFPVVAPCIDQPEVFEWATRLLRVTGVANDISRDHVCEAFKRYGIILVRLLSLLTSNISLSPLSRMSK